MSFVVSYENLKRVEVIGTSCAGKTDFSFRLSQLLGIKHIELDSLYWLPNWVPRSDEDFRTQVKKALAEDRWVLDGNYLKKVGDLVSPHLTAVFFLRYPWHVLLYRALCRLKKRVFGREVLYSGNYQTFYPALLTIIEIFFGGKYFAVTKDISTI